MSTVTERQETNTIFEHLLKEKNVLPYPTHGILALVAGMTLGLSAPGISPFMNQWYLAWFCIAPLLAFIFQSRKASQAALRAFLFGCGYNLVWLHWLFFFHPKENCHPALALFFLGTAVCHQGLLFAALGYIAHKLRRLPHVLLLMGVPLLWVLILNKVGNSGLTMGIPWSLIEYSQFCRKDILQIASCVGGIGLGALLVLFNLSLYFLVINFRKSSAKFSGLNKPTAITSFATICFLISGCLAFGNWKLEQKEQVGNKLDVSLIQGNISFRVHNAKPAEIFQRYYSLCASSPKNSLCIWPEIALPIPLGEKKIVIDSLASLAKSNSQAWIVGGLDKDKDGHIFNSLYAIDFGGKLSNEVYHKQTLVPFGERMPLGIAVFQLVKKLGFDTRGEDYYPGSKTTTFDIAGTKIGSAICLESAQPEFTSLMVRDGAQMLINSSNTTWFATDDIGKQLTAFGAMRAIESGRYFAFVTTVGPSCVIDDCGRIVAQAPSRETKVLSYPVPLKTEITPFMRWFR